jgi:hypothetical protein
VDVFAQPSWEAMMLLLPEVEVNVQNCKANKEKWRDLTALYDSKMINTDLD